jgi:hypothetical protein
MVTNIQEACAFDSDKLSCVKLVHSELLNAYQLVINAGFHDPNDSFTLSDIIRLGKTAFFWLGNEIIYFTASVVQLHDFFEIQPESFNGNAAGALSVLAVITIFSILAIFANE